jgi:hypothetical protein
MTRPVASAPPAFPAQMERRRARRFPYPALVRINDLAGAGIDISTNGLAVLLPEPIPVGTIVMVALGGGDDVSSSARVVRILPTPRGVVIGLQFVD